MRTRSGDSDEKAIRETERRKRQDQDRDDYNLENAGVDVGRIPRFLPASARPNSKLKEREQRFSETLSRLAILLQDPAYAALYQETVDLVNDYGAKAEAALSEAETHLSKAQAELDETLAQSARLPDGRRVFRSEDGTVYDQDGNAVSGPDAEGIIWPDNAPSYEDYLARKDALAVAKATVEAWQDYLLNVIGVARDRLADEENPLSPDEFQDWQDRVRDRFAETQAAKPDLAEAAHAAMPSFDQPKL